MKTLKFITVLLLLSALSSAVSLAKSTMSLKDASDKQLVSVKIHGTKSNAGTPTSSNHFGDCITVEVQNLTSDPLSLEIETGRKLTCHFDSIQNMMFTQYHLIALAGKQTTTYKAYAMCINEHKIGPDENSTYNIGDMAEGKLLQLALLIEKNKFQDNTGQNAVWVFTDNNDSTSIFSSNTKEFKALRAFVSSAKSKTTIKSITPVNKTDETVFIQRKEYKIAGVIQWNMKTQGYASLIVYDEQGNFITNIFDKRKFAAGDQSYDFNVVSCRIEPGQKYLVRLKIKDLTQEQLVCLSKDN